MKTKAEYEDGSVLPDVVRHIDKAQDIKCFKCEKGLYSAMVGIDPWEGPAGAVTLEGGWNFGSALYDAMMDGVYAEVVICDECLKAAQKDPQRMREMRKVVTPTKSERVDVKYDEHGRTIITKRGDAIGSQG